jgi:hypothetical protein
MPTTDGDTVHALQQRRAQLKTKLAQVGDLRPGSLVERYRRCGKAGCHCAARDAEGHGPSWSLTRKVEGRTVTRVIPAAAVAQTRQQMAEYQRFRRLVRELIETNEQLCNAQLDRGQGDLLRGGRPKKGCPEGLTEVFAGDVVTGIEALIGGGGG